MKVQRGIRRSFLSESAVDTQRNREGFILTGMPANVLWSQAGRFALLAGCYSKVASSAQTELGGSKMDFITALFNSCLYGRRFRSSPGPAVGDPHIGWRLSAA